MKVKCTGHNIKKGQPKDYSSPIWFNLAQGFREIIYQNMPNCIIDTKRMKKKHLKHLKIYHTILLNLSSAKL